MDQACRNLVVFIKFNTSIILIEPCYISVETPMRWNLNRNFRIRARQGWWYYLELKLGSACRYIDQSNIVMLTGKGYRCVQHQGKTLIFTPICEF